MIDSTTASSAAAPTTAAVKTYVDAQAEAAAGDILTGTQSTTDTTHALTNAATTTALNGKEDTSNKTQTIDSNSTSTQYPSAEAVYNAIDNATGGLTIPAQNTNVCTAQHPCALVDVAGTLHWYTMAQDGYNGGELGDAQ